MGNHRGIACPNCHPYHGRMLPNGQHPASYWELDWDYGDGRKEYWSCANCGYRRERRRRKPGTGQTPSQEKAIRRIIYHFIDAKYTAAKPCKISVRMTESGKAYVIIVKGDSVYSDEHFSAFVGRRGGIEVANYSFGVSKKEFNERMLETILKLLRAKKWKHYS